MAGRKESIYYDEAERLFVEGRTLQQIAGILPVSVATLSAWCQKGDWKARRQAALASSRNIATLLRDTLENKVRELGTAGKLEVSDYDAICKITAAIERLEKGSYSLRSAAVEVMQRFTDWLRQTVRDQEELKKIAGRIQAWFGSIE